MADLDQAIADAAEFDARLIGELREAVTATVVSTTALARNDHRWQNRTGQTREAITGKATNTGRGAKGEITIADGPAGDNAVRLATGTRPHEIRARNARVLRFQVGGQTVLRTSVQHPGTKPDPYLEMAAAHAEGKIHGLVFAAIDRLLP